MAGAAQSYAEQRQAARAAREVESRAERYLRPGGVAGGGRVVKDVTKDDMKGFVAAEKSAKNPGTRKAMIELLKKSVPYGVFGAEYLAAQDAVEPLRSERDAALRAFEAGTDKKHEAERLVRTQAELERAQALASSAVYNATGYTIGGIAGTAVGGLGTPRPADEASRLVAQTFASRLETAMGKTAITKALKGALLRALRSGKSRAGGNKQASKGTKADRDGGWVQRNPTTNKFEAKPR